jgi:hypothetical protein
MEQDMAAIQARMEGPPTTQVRNINTDTHIGQSPQRPYALLEDAMATISNGWKDKAALDASVAGAPEAQGLPDGAPNPNEVQGGDGGLFRYVVSQESREPLLVDGVVNETIRFEKRGVALTQQGARAATENGSPSDYWNGFTWLRDGVKPERDFPTMMKTQADAEAQPLVFTAPVSPQAAATYKQTAARAEAAKPVIPEEQTSRRAGQQTSSRAQETADTSSATSATSARKDKE